MSTVSLRAGDSCRGRCRCVQGQTLKVLWRISLQIARTILLLVTEEVIPQFLYGSNYGDVLGCWKVVNACRNSVFRCSTGRVLAKVFAISGEKLPT